MASKNKRNKVKFKWTKELGFLLLALAVVIGVTIGLGIPTKSERNLNKINDAITAYNKENETEYTTLSRDNNISVISHDKLIDKKNNNDTMIVWYGSLTDGTYLEAISALNSLADSYKIDKVYLYYNDFVVDAETDEENDSLAYKTERDERASAINDNASFEKLFDLEYANTLLVFKDNSLVFNSQIGQNTTAYSMNDYLLKAFSLAC